MDNLKYYNDSLAYDFNLFMPKSTSAKENNVIKMPQKKAKQRTMAKKRISAGLVAVLVTAFFLTAICGNIFLRIRINEVDSQINDINTEINELHAEYTKQYVNLEKVISYNNLEISAAQMGMKKMDKNQVVYIRVNDKNCAVMRDGQKVVSNE